MNAIPSVSINVPPAWFIQRFPGCLSQASDGKRSRNQLSPWFLDAAVRGETPQMREARWLLRRYLDAFLKAVSNEPNVTGIFAGDWTLLFGGLYHDECLGCWDPYALADYQVGFGRGRKPPAAYTDYLHLSPGDRQAFVLWQGAGWHFLQEYLRWIGDRAVWKFVDASTATDTVGDGNPKYGVLLTATRLNSQQKINAMVASGVQGICVDCSNLGDYGLVKQACLRFRSNPRRAFPLGRRERTRDRWRNEEGRGKRVGLSGVYGVAGGILHFCSVTPAAPRPRSGSGSSSRITMIAVLVPRNGIRRHEFLCFLADAGADAGALCRRDGDVSGGGDRGGSLGRRTTRCRRRRDRAATPVLLRLWRACFGFAAGRMAVRP